MTKNEIKAFAQDICRSQADDTTLDAYYDEAVEELGKEPSPVLVEAELFSYTADTAVYSYPADAIEILHLFHTDRRLPRITHANLEAYTDDWRATASGTPTAWTREREDARELRVYPAPDTTSDVLGVGATEPLGDEFPANAGAIIYSDARESSISDMIGLYLAFRILYKEFIRPSDHQDPAWAMLCKDVATFFYLVGVRKNPATLKAITQSRTTEE